MTKLAFWSSILAAWAAVAAFWGQKTRVEPDQAAFFADFSDCGFSGPCGPPKQPA